VLRILHKKGRKEKGGGAVCSRQGEASSASAVTDSSSASVTNDWKHWVALHGNDKMAADDVAAVGKTLGVIVKVDQENMFSALSKSGKGKKVTQ
jgi:hypothetical protein